MESSMPHTMPTNIIHPDLCLACLTEAHIVPANCTLVSFLTLSTGYQKHTGISHVLPEQACQKILTMPGALTRGIADGLVANSQSHHRRERLQGQEFWLLASAFCGHVPMNVHGGIMAHVHCATTALDTFPRCEVSHCPVVLGVGNCSRELKSAMISLIL